MIGADRYWEQKLCSIHHNGVQFHHKSNDTGKEVLDLKRNVEQLGIFMPRPLKTQIKSKTKLWSIIGCIYKPI